MPNPKIWSVNGISANFASVDLADGKGKDTFVRIEKVNERFTVVQGLDGSSTYAENAGNLHRVTVILLQSADANDKLSAIHATDQAIANGAGVGVLMIRDRNGRTVLTEPFARIEKSPDQEFGAEPGDLEWVFLCPNPQRFVGGNAQAGA